MFWDKEEKITEEIAENITEETAAAGEEAVTAAEEAGGSMKSGFKKLFSGFGFGKKDAEESTENYTE